VIIYNSHKKKNRQILISLLRKVLIANFLRVLCDAKSFFVLYCKISYNRGVNNNIIWIYARCVRRVCTFRFSIFYWKCPGKNYVYIWTYFI